MKNRNPRTLLQVLTFPDVYSKQSFSGVFLTTVLSHCDGLLPVASYPVLQTHTSPQLIREFTVSSRGGHPVPLFLYSLPSLTVSVHSLSPDLNNSTQAAYTAQVGDITCHISWKYPLQNYLKPLWWACPVLYSILWLNTYTPNSIPLCFMLISKCLKALYFLI